ncbi:MAG: Eco57I restriction-modification methylase domain-containing protein, partial [Caldilineaceae bacterium]|nr:Eco57I restriction-modification methylase domain-containing protein [Caldilineaceae bacterium]
VLRPRTLTVNRRKPTSVALRVLSRFTWTEDDSDLQWEKLRTAFALAEWTEEYFNNRALFSDYYLKERLTDPALSPVWHEDVRPLGSAIFPLVTAARQKFTSQPEAAIRQGFFAPIFQLLGFDAVVNKPGDADGTAPDYFLYAPGDRSQPLAAVLTYVWNRNLDDIDPGRDTETPDGIPGALVVSTLEHKQAPWVIVTNGKTWRLYAAAADNKATNYYEVDLEEAFAAQDQVTALKYWWLFFRHAAFTGFLAGLQQQSAAYAKQLGERLKGRVFEEIFPHFAAGFIADMRARGAAAPPVAGPPNEFGVCYEKPAEAGWRGGEIDLDLVFQATLTFLYRLIFVAYAESLELLPVTESHGYGAQSLRTLKAEVAANGGAIEDAAPAQLERAYAASSTALYGRLQTLFRAIDAGAPTLNLPTYNGGLFSADTPAGQFLAAYAVPDRHLALGLDRLCRDVDDKTHALVFVDFKSLGVRQLGSIYEGLLEFKVRIAREALAVVKEGGKELYVPLAQAGSKRVLATLAAGDVYLENDKCERKATGSYYTPDYIVKYIVAHTVGPVLERKFDELAPRLHDAQKRYRQSKAVVVPKGQNPEMFWNDEALHLLADACLDVKVLDPAMGSGHFLVEAVDYLSDRLIDWLNGWSENPVWALLERTRGDILADMERQQVSIAGERLVRVALLKRAVLKRCIYGVDLNAMAVELAKVSLWLDAFTLGAPLSFLDHHLKQGNSLIGSRVGEVQAALQKRERERQMFLFTGNKFAGMFAAVEAMRLVSYLSDNTVEQVQASRTSYSEAVGYVAPFKRTLDVYISRWFGNPDGRAGSSPTLDFLDSPDTEPWIERPTADNLARLGTDQHRVAETSLHSATEKQFFHWELEFPEVFFVQSEQSKASIQLREEGGFDAVVGNPPYDELSVESLGRPVDERDFMKESDLYAPGRDSEGRLNWYHFFMMRGTELLRNAGRVGYIVPMSWMGDSFTLGVRKWLIEKHTPQSIDAFPQKDDPHNRVFMEAKLPTSIFIAARNTQSQNMRIRVHPGKDILPVPYY